MIIRCDSTKGGCGNEFEVSEETYSNDNYIQCPHCGRIADIREKKL